MLCLNDDGKNSVEWETVNIGDRDRETEEEGKAGEWHTSNALKESTTEAPGEEIKKLVWARNMDSLSITREKVAFEGTDANRELDVVMEARRISLWLLLILCWLYVLLVELASLHRKCSFWSLLGYHLCLWYSIILWCWTQVQISIYLFNLGYTVLSIFWSSYTILGYSLLYSLLRGLWLDIRHSHCILQFCKLLFHIPHFSFLCGILSNLLIYIFSFTNTLICD